VVKVNNHRLRGSASPVLTTTHIPMGVRDFLTFFDLGSRGQTPNGPSRKMAQTACIHARVCLLQ